MNNAPASQNNRLGGTRGLALYGGTFNFTANGTTALAETTTGALTYGWGTDTLSLTNAGTASSTLTFGSIAGGGGSVLNILTSGGALGSSMNSIVLTTTAALTPANVGIIPRVTVNGTNFVTSGTNGALTPFTAYSAAGSNLDLTSSAGTDTLNLSLTPTWAQSFTKTVNAVALGNGVTFNASAAGQTLTPTTGNILVGSGSAAIGSGVVTALAGVENALLVNTGATLNVQGPITGTYNLTKGLGGTLIFSAPVYDTTTTNWLCLNGGTVQLNAGNSTLLTGISVGIQPGAVFDLNGNAQYITSLAVNNTPGAGNSIAAGSVVSSSGTGTLVVNSNNNFPGQIVGNINFAKAGGNAATLSGGNSYSGPTAISGGTVTLQDAGVLANTPSITVNAATLSMADNGLAGISNRLGSAPVTLNGGVLNYTGRAQTASVESVAAVTLGSGESFITSTAGGTNLNSADLMLAGLTPTNDATVDFSSVAGSTGASGLIGSSNRVQIAGMTNTDNIIGGWAVTLRDFASYLPTLGVGPLNQTGFAGYSNVSQATSTWQPTDNVKLTSPTTTMTASTTINTLNVAYSVNSTLDLGGNTLTLGAGGLMFDTGASNVVVSLQDGTVTAGTSSAPTDLYLWYLPYGGVGRTGTASAAIANNAAGGPVRLVFNGSDSATNLLTLNGNNTYTGGTVINSGMLVLGASGTLPAGGITLNGSLSSSGANASGLTQTAGGVIAPQAVTLNGPATLTLAGNNALASITFNNNGGTVTPTVTTGGTLSLPGNGIAVSSSNPATVATINGTLSFGGSAVAITVNPITVLEPRQRPGWARSTSGPRSSMPTV